MNGRIGQLLLGLALVTTALAGCLADDQPLTANELAAPGATLTVQDPDGQPLAMAPITALDGADQPIAILSTGTDGTLALARLPAQTQGVLVDPGGHDAWQGNLEDLPETLVLTLSPDDDPEPPAPDDPRPILATLEPVLLGGAYLADQEESCETYNCGASEPTVEVASDGTIYVSGVCCVGQSPPIWYSQDGGESFQLLEGDPLRDTFGIEGDFAIDDAGNLYFSDISAASSYFSSWDGDQEHRHTVPAYPFRPLVDRPWVRAAGEDVVYFAYNSGSTTEVHKSTDGAITWTQVASFGGPLGTIGNHPTDRDHLYVVVRGTLHESLDGGETWEAPVDVPTPSEDGDTFQAYWVPVVDEAGNLWVVYDWRQGETSQDDEPYHVYAARRDAGGTWHGPYQVSPDEGTHHLPWPATGADGTLAVAWYGTLDDDQGPNSVDDEARWYVHLAATLDGTAETPRFSTVLADPEPVHQGPMDRKLLDFLQLDVGPDGALHLAYAQDRGDRPDELTQYVRTTTGLDLAPQIYPNGP